MRKQDDSLPPQLMDAVPSVPQRTELRQALDGAWYPFDGDKDTPSYKSHYGGSAQMFWDANFLEQKQAFISPPNLATVTSQQHSEPTVSMSSNDDFNRSVQSEVSPPAWLSNHPAQKHDNFERIGKDTFIESVPSSLEPTIIPPEPRSAVRLQSSDIAVATGCVVGLEPSAAETTSFRCFLFVTHGSASLSKFASLLAGCDDEVEFDAPTDEYAVHKQHGATTSSSWATRSGIDQPPSTMPSNTNEQPRSGSTGTAGGAAGGGGGRGCTSADARKRGATGGGGGHRQATSIMRLRF